ncbi:DUF11 domain-containing protein, partial [bacterium]|nr:DUF11 domain-containing protein [bacterium]
MSRFVKHALFIIGFLTAALSAALAQTPAGTSIVNRADVWYDDGAGASLTVPSNQVKTIVGSGSLRVAKSANRTEVSVWDTLVYRLEIQNIDAAPLTHVVVRDTLPRMLLVIHAEPSALVADNTVEWQIPSLASGETRIHMVTCLVYKTVYHETFENSAVYFADGGIRGRSNRVITVWHPWPEAVLEKIADLQSVYTGDTLTYTLSVRNTGAMPLSNIQVTDSLPQGFSFIDASPDVQPADEVLVWNITQLARGGRQVLSFRGIVTTDVPGDSLHNMARLSSDEGATDLANTSTAFRGQGTGLYIEKQAPDSVFWAGDTLTYDLVLGNSGLRSGRQVVIRDTLPDGLAYIASTHGGLHDGQIVVWNMGDLEPGYHDTLRVTVSVRIPVQDRTIIDNEVWAWSAQGLADSSYQAIRVRSVSRAGLTKTAEQAVVYTGDTLTYRLQVRNTGTTHLYDIAVRDSLPAGIAFISASQPVDTSGGILVWHIPALDYGKTAQLTFLSRVTGPEGAVLKNTAALVCADTIRSSSTVSTAFRGHGVGIDIVKEAADSLFNAGDTLTYDLILTNGGIRTGHSIVVRDTLPDELAYLSSTHGGQHVNQIVTWHLGDLSPGYQDTLRVTAGIRVPIEDQTVVNNEVWARSSQGAQDSSHWRIVVTSHPRLLLEIEGPEIASPGDTIRFMLIYSNTGTATAFEPILTDTLPVFLDYVGASGEHVHIPAVDAVHWFLPPLAPGDRDTLYLYARLGDNVTPEDEIVNSAWLSYKRASKVAIATCVTKSVPPGDRLWAYKTVNRKTAAEGDTLEYCIVFGTYDRAVTDTIHISDALPGELNWIQDGIMPKPGTGSVSYNPVLHSIRFTHIGLQANARDSVRFVTIVRTPLAPGIKEIENQALVMVHGDTVRTEEDTRTQSRTRLVKPFLTVKKAVNRKVAGTGDVLTYTLTVRNKSIGTPFSEIVLRDLLPAGFRYQAGSSRLDSVRIEDPRLGHSENRVLMEWTLRDTLDPGETLVLRYRIIVGLDTRRGERENRVTASGLAEGIWIHS